MGFLRKIFGTEDHGRDEILAAKSKYIYASSIASMIGGQIRDDGIKCLQKDIFVYLTNSYNISIQFGGSPRSFGVAGYVKINELKSFTDFVEKFPKFYKLDDPKKSAEVYAAMLNMYLGERLDQLSMATCGVMCQRIPELKDTPMA